MNQIITEEIVIDAWNEYQTTSYQSVYNHTIIDAKLMAAAIVKELEERPIFIINTLVQLFEKLDEESRENNCILTIPGLRRDQNEHYDTTIDHYVKICYQEYQVTRRQTQPSWPGSVDLAKQVSVLMKKGKTWLHTDVDSVEQSIERLMMRRDSVTYNWWNRALGD